MEYHYLIVEKKDKVALVTLNRPEKLNAVNLEMRSEFLQLLDELETDDHIRVVIVTGAGRAFCAGSDISELGSPKGDWRQQATQPIATVKRIYKFEKPIIGAINGVSAGDGSQWLLAFDLNIASNKARIAWPATKLGIL